MLRINLLPPHIYERRRVRKAIVAFSFLFLVVLFGMLTWWFMLTKKQNDLQLQVNDMEQKAQEVRMLQDEIAKEQARIASTRAKVEFIEAVMEYNLEYPKLYEELAKYTYSRMLYRSIQPAGNQLTIQAHARTLGDCGRYLMNMYRATHLFSSVSISGVPGWPQQGEGGGGLPGGFDFTVTCTLVKPITPPTYTGVAQAASSGVAPGVPGGPSPMPPGAAGPSVSPPSGGGSESESGSRGIFRRRGGGESEE